MANMDPEIFPIFIGLFAGPEVIPKEVVDERVIESIRRS
jgi:hypothetical protein